VALARAFANRPKILFADEPTGNLDVETGGAIVAMLEELNREAHTTLVLVTHDLELAERAHRVVSLASGRIVSDRPGRSSGGGAFAADSGTDSDAPTASNSAHRSEPAAHS